MKYIIGSGIAGLIAAFYNPDYTVIGDKVGGQMTNGELGPRLLEVNDNSARLLEDLDYSLVPIKTAKIGYKVKGHVVNTLSPELRKEYYLKSRCLKKSDEIPDSIMSDGKNEIKYFDIDWNDLINKLVASIGVERFIEGKVTKIDTADKRLEIESLPNPALLEVRISPYDHIISTIPAPFFFKLANLEPEEKLEVVPKVFIIVPEIYLDLKGYDYLYIPEKEFMYHRVTKLDNGLAAIEYTTTVNPINLLTQWRTVAKRHHVLKAGQIKSGKVQKIPGVTFLGRYAEWNHDVKTDDAVERSVAIRTATLIGEEI